MIPQLIVPPRLVFWLAAVALAWALSWLPSGARLFDGRRWS